MEPLNLVYISSECQLILAIVNYLKKLDEMRHQSASRQAYNEVIEEEKNKIKQHLKKINSYL